MQWVQEEPKNQGMWPFMECRFRNLIRKLGHGSVEPVYAGRAISPSTATGYGKQHAAELQSILEAAMTI